MNNVPLTMSDVKRAIDNYSDNNTIDRPKTLAISYGDGLNLIN